MLIELLVPSALLALLLLAALTVGAYLGHMQSWLNRCRHVLALLTLWVWTCCTPGVANWLMARLEGPVQASEEIAVAPDAGASIVVLASGDMWAAGGRPAPRLDEHGWERLHAGVELWRRTGGLLIFTGGPGDTRTTSLAGMMGGVAEELGVPAESIGLAVRSNTTYQDLKAARPLIRGDGPVWLVTSAVHMPRALAVARQMGIEARPYPVDYRQIRRPTWRVWLPDGAATERMTVVGHEMIGRLWYRWKGWSQ